MRTGPIIIGDTGEEFIVAEWSPDPQVLKAEILHMADSFENWETPMLETRQLIIENTKLYFQDEFDPDGRPWVPLDPIYELEKERLGKSSKILNRDGALEAFATSEKAWIIDGDAIYFNAEGLPVAKDGAQYGAVHQAGTADVAQAEMNRALRTLKINASGTIETTTKQDAAIRAGGSFEGGSGKNLPQRMFIGIDEDTIGFIEDVFIRYLEKTIEKPWGGGGIVGGVMTTTGLVGLPTGVSSFGGGFSVRGSGGRFIGHTLR